MSAAITGRDARAALRRSRRTPAHRIGPAQLRGASPGTLRDGTQFRWKKGRRPHRCLQYWKCSRRP